MAQLTQDSQQCINDSQACHAQCLLAIKHCLVMGGSHAAEAHIQLLRDCAEICQATADFMLGNSGFHREVCSLAADICTACAASCESYPDDKAMLQCAEVCRRCADSCTRMSRKAA